MLGQIESAFDERPASEDRLRRFVADASHELRTPLTRSAATPSCPAPAPSPTSSSAAPRSAGSRPRRCAWACSSTTCCCSRGSTSSGRSSAARSTSSSSWTRRPRPAGGRTGPGRHGHGAGDARRRPATRPGCARWSTTCSRTPGCTPPRARRSRSSRRAQAPGHGRIRRARPRARHVARRPRARDRAVLPRRPVAHPARRWRQRPRPVDRPGHRRRPTAVASRSRRPGRRARR